MWYWESGSEISILDTTYRGNHQSDEETLELRGWKKCKESSLGFWDCDLSVPTFGLGIVI